jgi:ribosomal protein S19
MRSLWKGPYVNIDLYNQIIRGKKNITTMDRSSTIVEDCIYLDINVYNGQKYKTLAIEEHLLGYKLGEFVLTKKRCIYRNKKGKKKKK